MTSRCAIFARAGELVIINFRVSNSHVNKQYFPFPEINYFCMNIRPLRSRVLNDVSQYQRTPDKR
jgi:hypothetical protein